MSTDRLPRRYVVAAATSVQWGTHANCTSGAVVYICRHRVGHTSGECGQVCYAGCPGAIMPVGDFECNDSSHCPDQTYCHYSIKRCCPGRNTSTFTTQAPMPSPKGANGGPASRTPGMCRSGFAPTLISCQSSLSQSQCPRGYYCEAGLEKCCMTPYEAPSTPAVVPQVPVPSSAPSYARSQNRANNVYEIPAVPPATIDYSQYYRPQPVNVQPRQQTSLCMFFWRSKRYPNILIFCFGL